MAGIVVTAIRIVHARQRIDITRSADSQIAPVGGVTQHLQGLAALLDFQKEVHEDMQRNFGLYPRNWGLKAPDTNIDHRRVPNLMTWLQRKGKALPITRNEKDYQPGDIVTWDFSDGQQHIGIVSNIRASSERFAIVHNVGAGTKVEDVLFRWQQIGHYRYFRS